MKRSEWLIVLEHINLERQNSPLKLIGFLKGSNWFSHLVFASLCVPASRRQFAPRVPLLIGQCTKALTSAADEVR